MIAVLMAVSPSAVAERRRQAGLSLIELMVAMGIAIFMLAGVVSLVVSVSRSRAELDKTSEQVENGRYAIQQLSEDVRLAGFYGAGQLVPEIQTTPDICATTLTAAELGFDGDDLSLPLPVQPTPAVAASDSCLSNATLGQPAITLRRVITQSEAAPATGNHYIQHSACNDDAETVAAGTTGFSLRHKDCTQAAPVWRLLMRTYFIAGCDNCAGATDGIPTLKMVEFNGTGLSTPASLAQGIEFVNFTYGFDLNGDGTTDCYGDDPAAAAAPAGCPAGWSAVAVENAGNITSVKISVLARSVTATPGWTDDRTYDVGAADRLGPFNDSFKRRVYSSVVVLPNVAGVRE